MRLLLLLIAGWIALLDFEPIQPDLFAAGGALTNAWADYDGDGHLDLFVGFSGTPNRLYRTDSGRFRDVAAEAGLADQRPTRAAAWGDYDGDGDPDLLVGFAPGPAPVLRFYQNAAGRFQDITREAGLLVDSGAVRQFSWLDLDDDGDLDLFVAWRDRPNALFRNTGGRFQNVAAELGLADPRKSVGALWFDYQEDGDLDLLVANQDGDANGLFQNQGGRFRDVAEAAGVAWGGRAPGERTNGSVRPCAADVDGDGQLDLYFANYGKNGLLLGRPEGRFEDVSERWGVALDARYDTCALADVDHDGRIDLYVNGTVTGGVSYPDYLFRNTGQRFEDVTPAIVRAQPASHGAVWADFDRDGDLDLALAGTAAGAAHPVLRNLLPADAARRSLQILVLDGNGRATRAGTEVRVYGPTRRLLGTRLLDTGSGYNSQSELPVHFGLPEAGPVTLEITTPWRGQRRTARVRDLKPEQFAGRVLRVRVDERGNAAVERR